MNKRSTRNWMILMAMIACASFGMLACGDLEGGDNNCDPEVDGEECVCDDDEDLSTCYFESDDPAGDTEPQTVTIEINTAEVSQSSVTIPVNSTITWINNAQDPRNVTFAHDPSIDFTLSPGQRQSHIFRQAGTFTYKDRINNFPDLKGTIIVE